MKKKLQLLIIIFILPLLAIAQPVNDDCDNAVLLTPASGTTCTPVTGTTAAVSSTDYDPCIEFSKRNVWYKFTATSSTHIVQVSFGTMQNGIIDVFTGTCAARTNVSTCSSGQPGPVIQKILTGLTAGQEYFAAVSTRNQSEEGSFDICIITPPAPPNDDCINAVILTPATGNIANFTNGTTLFATQSQPGCSGTADDDVWYKFTASQATHRITIKQLTMQGTAIVQLFSGTCGALVSMNCFSNFPSSNNVSGLTVGQEYFMRVYANGSNGAGTFQAAITSAPANDECNNAFSIVPNAAGAVCNTPINASTVDATQSSLDCFGSNSTDDDVWYSFTATHSAHEIRIIKFKSNLGRVELFTGNCAGLNSFIPCNGYVSSLLGTDTTVFTFGALTPGTVYTLRIYSNATGNSAASDFGFCLNTPLTAANDECSGATNIIPAADSSYNPVTQTMDGSATGSRQLICGTVSPESINMRDLWYKFTAIAAQQTIRINISTFSSYDLYVYSGSCGALSNIVCSGNDTLIGLGNLNIGDTYYYRIVSNIGTFIIQTAVITPSVDANDECTAAVSITPSSNTTCNTVAGNTGRSTHSQAVCAGSFTNQQTIVKDLWYSFVANSNSSRIRVTIAGQPNNGTAFQVMTGSCNSQTPIFCSTEMVSNDTLREQRLDGLVIGQTYFIRVFSRANGAVPFTICIKKVVPPANDDCSGAINLTVASSISTLQPISVNLQDASQSIAGCTGTADDDTWFSFTATNDSLLLFIDKTSTDNSIVQMFTGSCGSLTSVSCLNGVFTNTGGIMLLTGLTPGTDYLFRTYGSGSFGATPVNGVLRAGLYEPVGIPLNDACANAIALTPSANNDCNFITGSNNNTVSNTTNCQTGLTTSDVWYKFVAGAASHKIIAEGDIYLPQLQVLNGGCAAASLICVSNANPRYTETTLSSLVIGNTYFIRVFNGSADVKTTGSFRLCISTPVVPLNDNCIGAIPLPVCAENTACSNGTLFSTQSATASGDISACSGSAGNDDVWFSFTATGKPTSIAVDILNNQHSLQLLQGTCGSLTSMVCNSSRNILACPPLVNGQTYFLRLFSVSTSSTVRSSFKIKVYETEPVKAIDPLLRVIYDTACLGPVLNLNGEFENFSICPNTFIATAAPGAALIPNWTFPTAGTSDYLNDCGQSISSAVSVSVPGNNCFGYQEPRNGKGYVGLFGYTSTGVREYIQSALSAPLEPGKKYMVSFYTSLSDYSTRAIDQLGVRFNSSATAQNISLNLAQVPQVTSAPGTFITDQQKWVNVRGLFTADQAYTHFIIGNFNNNSNTNTQNVNDSSGQLNGGPYPGCTSPTLSDLAYYFIDDVVIAEVTGTSSVCLGGSLPVTWLDFEIRKENRDAVLQWRTVNEFNCRNYEIERSRDGIHFIKAGATLCYNNAGSNIYNWKDIDPGMGKWFYRIKQFDLDGKFSYSIIQSISFSKKDALLIYPNPVITKLEMEWKTSAAKISMNIYDATGKLVMQKSILYSNRMQVDVSMLAAGMYHLSLSDGNTWVQENFIKK